jgi:hypothetical protein
MTTVYDGRLMGGFWGYHRGNLYVLDCGTMWEQVDDNTAASYADFPRFRVLFDPSDGGYFLFVVGMDSVAEVVRYEERRKAAGGSR